MDLTTDPLISGQSWKEYRSCCCRERPLTHINCEHPYKLGLPALVLFNPQLAVRLNAAYTCIDAEWSSDYVNFRWGFGTKPSSLTPLNSAAVAWGYLFSIFTASLHIWRPFSYLSPADPVSSWSLPHWLCETPSAFVEKMECAYVLKDVIRFTMNFNCFILLINYNTMNTYKIKPKVIRFHISKENLDIWEH